jgi:hypothetical protein
VLGNPEWPAEPENYRGSLQNSQAVPSPSAYGCRRHPRPQTIFLQDDCSFTQTENLHLPIVDSKTRINIGEIKNNFCDGMVRDCFNNHRQRCSANLYQNRFDGYTLYYGLLPHRLFVNAFFIVAGFLFGIGGMLIEIRDRKIMGIVICIICVLINFIFLDYCCSMDVAAYESNKRVACASKIKRICLVLQQYAADNAGNFPPANALRRISEKVRLSDHAAYICPTTVRGRNNQPLSEENVDYVYVGGLMINHREFRFSMIKPITNFRQCRFDRWNG